MVDSITRRDVPSSRRNFQDCNLSRATFNIAHEYVGRIVPRLTDRNGQRNHMAQRNTVGWGGITERIFWWRRCLHHHNVDVKSR